MRFVYLAWRDPVQRRFYPIGRLSYDGHAYYFAYTKGAQFAERDRGFAPLRGFPRLEVTYQSESLFPFFANRIPPRTRSDFKDFLSYLKLGADSPDPLAILERSEARRATDTLEVFGQPARTSTGEYQLQFFVHGVRYFPEDARKRVEVLKPSERLLVVHDLQNPKDPNALILRTSETFPGDQHLVGYCPRYLSEDLLQLLHARPDDVKVTVERLNPAAPIQLRLLCSVTAPWPAEFTPFSGESYEPLADHDVALH